MRCTNQVRLRIRLRQQFVDTRCMARFDRVKASLKSYHWTHWKHADDYIQVNAKLDTKLRVESSCPMAIHAQVPRNVTSETLLCTGKVDAIENGANYLATRKVGPCYVRRYIIHFPFRATTLLARRISCKRIVQARVESCIARHIRGKYFLQ